MRPQTAGAYTRLRERVGVVLQDPDDQLLAPVVSEDLALGPAIAG